MYSQAVGFNPGAKMLSGLNQKGPAGAFAKGQAMAASAGLDMDREAKNQELGVQQMQQDSQLRQQDSQNKATSAGQASQYRVQKGGQDSRDTVFNTGMQYDYASLNKRRQTQLQQSLLNNLARDF